MCVLLCSSIKCNVTAHFKDFRNTMTMKHYETHWSTHRFCNSLRLTVKRSICFPQPLRVFDHLHARDQQTLQYEHSHLDRNRPYLGIRFRRWYWFFLTRFQHLQVPSSVMFPLASSYHTSDPDIACMLWPFKCLFINWSKKNKGTRQIAAKAPTYLFHSFNLLMRLKWFHVLGLRFCSVCPKTPSLTQSGFKPCHKDPMLLIIPANDPILLYYKPNIWLIFHFVEEISIICMGKQVSQKVHFPMVEEKTKHVPSQLRTCSFPNNAGLMVSGSAGSHT